MSIRCKQCGKFIWSFSTNVCYTCAYDAVSKEYSSYAYQPIRSSTSTPSVRSQTRSSFSVADTISNVADSWSSSSYDCSSGSDSSSSCGSD